VQPATANIEDIYELSPLQQGMLFQSLYAPGTGVYVEQIAYHVAGAFNIGAFDAAWQAVAAAHPILRTSFFFDDLAKPLQVVDRRVKIPVEHHDLAGVPDDERADRLEAYLRIDAERGFTISEAPLVRLACFTTRDAADVVLTFHHALLDGWSLQLLMQDLTAAYQAHCWGRPVRPPFRRPYSDYIGWLQSQSRAAAEKHWRARLEGFAAPTPLNIDTLPVPGEPDAAHGVADKRLSAESTRLLGDFARRRQITINTVVQGAWAILLSRYSAESDVLFGSVVSGRPTDLPGAEQMIGLFINTVPVRANLAEDPLVDEWLKRLQEQSAEEHSYHFSPVSDLQSWSDVPPDRPLFESVLVFENYPGMDRPDARPASASARHIERTNLPLTLLIVPGQQLLTRVLFDARKFDRPAIERLLGHFERILCSIANGAPRLSAVQMTTAAEVDRLVRGWNDAVRAPEEQWDLASRFEEVVSAHQHEAALLHEGRKVTYSELNSLANRIAHGLADGGARSGSRIAVCLGRSVDGVAALLAVLKLRAVYVPMDPVSPPAALRHMECAASVELVITRRELAAQFADSASTRIFVDDLVGDDSANPGRDPVAPTGVMYIVFTSGSTGRPKAIAVEHRQVLNRLEWMWREYPFDKDEVACFKTSPSFVDHLWEVLGALLAGVPTLVIPDETARNPEALIEALAAGAVSRLWLVPSLLRTLLGLEGLSHRVPRLRFWVSSGEALTPELYAYFCEVMPGATLFNLYGTSEVWDATWFDPVRERQPYCGQIGRPIRNVRTYVLLQNGEPAPIGVPGELCIGGSGVACGYLGDDAGGGLFVEDPFTAGRMYRSGDVCRYLADGNIQFLGRRDHQVKVRGQRIELTQIESILDECPGVLLSAVALRNGDGAARLVAYVAPAPGVALDARRLRGYARERLSPSMRPAGYVIVDRIPLTVSGKVDRMHIPAVPVDEELDLSSEPPQTDTERRVAELFGEVIQKPRVGRADNFFTELGGNSLLATQLVSRIRDAFSTELALRVFFDEPTVEQIARRVGGTQVAEGAVSPIPRQPRRQTPSTARPAERV
jgi:amino acid adenylation domain-containing protein